jgi:hypothetical protein
MNPHGETNLFSDAQNEVKVILLNEFYTPE